MPQVDLNNKLPLCSSVHTGRAAFFCKMEYLAFIFAAFIGISLGLIGAGGSILTVPVLVYLAGVEPVKATAYSLFIVGATALVGAFQNHRKGGVDLKTAMVFGIPSIIAVYLTRLLIMPLIPEIIDLNFALITKPTLILTLFAGMMAATSYSMIKGKKRSELEMTSIEAKPYRIPLILLEGVGVGVLTGLVGAGGGFLIIPALVILVGLDMKIAIGTSLLIIAMKSLIGFTGDLQAGMVVDWRFLLIFTSVSIGGIFLGNRLGSVIDGQRLKTSFGWFILAMAIYIIANQMLFA